MSNYIVSDTDLTSVANAIRTKGGTSAALSFPTEFVSAIEAIPSGGGTVYSGYVELTNTSATELVIPVDVSMAGEFEVIAYCDRTGTVSDGVVSYDPEPICATDYPAATNCFVWYVAATEIHQKKNMKRDASNYTTVNRPGNVTMCYVFRENNGSSLALIQDPVYNNQIKLDTTTQVRHFCREGLYARFAYTVVVE